MAQKYGLWMNLSLSLTIAMWFVSVAYNNSYFSLGFPFEYFIVMLFFVVALLSASSIPQNGMAGHPLTRWHFRGHYLICCFVFAKIFITQSKCPGIWQPDRIPPKTNEMIGLWNGKKKYKTTKHHKVTFHHMLGGVGWVGGNSVSPFIHIT